MPGGLQLIGGKASRVDMIEVTQHAHTSVYQVSSTYACRMPLCSELIEKYCLTS